jgi:hypothetical protein
MLWLDLFDDFLSLLSFNLYILAINGLSDVELIPIAIALSV